MATHRKKPETSLSQPLSREHIVATALELVDRESLGALSMRRLGAELGVDPMAIYYHVPNKAALLDAIIEAVMAQIDLGGDDPAAAPDVRILEAARCYRDAMLKHIKALPIVLARPPSTINALRPVERLLAILDDAGFSPGMAMAGMNMITAAVRGIVGMALHGAPPDQEPGQSVAEAGQSQAAAPGMAGGAALPEAEFPHLGAMSLCTPAFLGADFDYGITALARGLLASRECVDPDRVPR